MGGKIRGIEPQVYLKAHPVRGHNQCPELLLSSSWPLAVWGELKSEVCGWEPRQGLEVGGWNGKSPKDARVLAKESSMLGSVVFCSTLGWRCHGVTVTE